MNRSPQPEDTVTPKSRAEWRSWLETHHRVQDSVWVIYHKKASGVPRVSWKDAVEEALCFGWIDGRAQPIDEHRYRQHFCRRKTGSMWSKINKDSVGRLIEQGLMRPAGLAAVEAAIADGSWNLLDEVETLQVPQELQAALDGVQGAADGFAALSRSVRKFLLQRLSVAKRPETREKRIAEAVAQGLARYAKDSKED